MAKSGKRNAQRGKKAGAKPKRAGKDAVPKGVAPIPPLAGAPNIDVPKIVAEVKGPIIAHTDVLLTLKQDGVKKTKAQHEKLSSGLHTIYNGNSIVLSCEHSTIKDGIYFTAPRRLKTDIIPEGVPAKVPNILLLGVSKELDAAVFDAADLELSSANKLP